LATESSPTEVHYLTYPEAVMLHIMLMRRLGESHFGVFDRTLVESALARPRHAATFEGANLMRQAATRCFGLIKNHPWLGGNKRHGNHPG
jgi:death on curing protein